MASNLVDPAMAIGVAKGTNRLNSQGAAILNEKSRTSQIISNIVPAGGTLPMPIAGNLFYFLIATLPLKVRPQGGVFNSFSQGQGQSFSLENQFNLLELKNEAAVPVVFSIFVGFDGFIDNTLIINNAAGEVNMVYPTYATVNSAANILITDLSGTQLNDLNGNAFYALQRTAIYLSNADSAAVFSIVNTANNKTVMLLQPLQSLELPWRGNFRITQGGNINAIVSETYRAIPVTIT